ncbi:MAG: cupin domain-containing protein [Candidatus Woesearchaeota archaeon]
MDKEFLKNIYNLIEYPKQGINSNVILKKGTYNYTLMCFAKGSEISSHTSTRDAVIFVLEGKGIIILNNKKYVLKKGNFIFMPANMPHSLEAKEKMSILLILTK